MDVSNIRNRKGQRLDATFHPAPNTGYLALLGHGVTGNKDRPLMIGLADELALRGIPALRFSFAGNGKSEGRFQDCTITSETEDLVDLLDRFSNNRRIIYIGHSMGGAVGTLVAAREPDRIQNFVSLAGMVNTREFFQREFGDQVPDEGFMWDEPNCPLSNAAMSDAIKIENTLRAIKRITQPWLLIHGTDDDVVPIADTHQAIQAADTQTQLLEFPGEGHMFSEPAYPKIAQAIATWLQH